VSYCNKSTFLQVRENWKKSGNLSGQGKLRGKYFLGKVREKSGKVKNWCHQMSDFQAKMHQIRFPLRLRPRPRWGAYSAPADHVAVLNIAP